MTRLITAELRKLTTTRTSYGLIAAAAALVVLGTAAPLAFADPAGPGFALSNEFTQRTLLASSGTTAGTIAIVLGIIGMAGEYRHGTITPSLLATPHRPRFMIAKIISYAGVGLLLGLTMAALSLAISLLGLRLRAVDLVLSAGNITAILGGGILYFTLAGVFGVGVGAAIRSQVAALATVLITFFVVENLLVGLVPDVARWLPGQAASALYFPGDTPTDAGLVGAEVIAQPLGALALTTYTVAVAILGVALASRRDVT